MSEEMAIVEELHDINRKLTAGIQVDTYGEMQVINRAANAITRLTEENAALREQLREARDNSVYKLSRSENRAIDEALRNGRELISKGRLVDDGLPNSLSISQHMEIEQEMAKAARDKGSDV